MGDNNVNMEQLSLFPADSLPHEIKFARKNPWECAAYNDFYIQDRFTGKDVYGHDSYQYALFRRCPFRLIQKFRTRKQAYVAFGDVTGISEFDIRMGAYEIISGAHGGRFFGVQSGDKIYRLDRYNRTIEVRPIHDTRISPWCDKYAECVTGAKQIIARLETGHEI